MSTYLYDICNYLTKDIPKSINQLNARVSGVLSVLDRDNVQLRYMRCFDVLVACVRSG